MLGLAWKVRGIQTAKERPLRVAKPMFRDVQWKSVSMRVVPRCQCSVVSKRKYILGLAKINLGLLGQDQDQVVRYCKHFPVNFSTLVAQVWSSRFSGFLCLRPCSGGSCQTISRRDFFTSYQGVAEVGVLLGLGVTFRTAWKWMAWPSPLEDTVSSRFHACWREGINP